MKLQIDRAAGRITSNFNSIRDCRIYSDAPTKAKRILGDESEAEGKDLPSPRENYLRLRLRIAEAAAARKDWMIQRVRNLQAEIQAARV
jgi:hypothetical protein